MPSNTRAKHGASQFMIPGKTAFSLIAPEEGFKAGTELRFEYHGHANSELWAEYGFAEMPEGGWEKGKYSELDLNHLVRRRWKEDPQKVAALEKIGCWACVSRSVGHNRTHLSHDTLHAYPTYEASHTLLMTLRVLFLEAGQENKLGPIAAATVTFVSEENEVKVKKAIVEMCQEALDEAKAARELLKDKADPMLNTLWGEHEDIARGCITVYS